MKGDFAAALDFFERVLGSNNLQNLLDGSVLGAMAVDSSAGKSVDPLEGLGAFALPNVDATVVLLGVTDESAALEELVAKGAVNGQDGALEVELRDGTNAAVFADRGYLFAVFPHAADAVATVMKHVRSADGRGLEQSPVFSSLPQTGRIVLLAAPKDRRQLPIDALWATLSIGPRKARLEGRLISDDPLWQTQGQSSQLFSKAWEGPVAALAAKLPRSVVRSVLKQGSPEREQSQQRLRQHGIDVEKMLDALTGDVSALVWFDAEAFLRNLVEGTERPEPRGTALVELRLSDSAAWDAAIDPMLEVFLPVRPRRTAAREGTTWQTRVAGQDASLTLEAKALTAQIGSGTKGRTLVNLSAALSQRYAGAFSKGHASLLIDLARLRAELETPRMIDGLDAMQVVTVQGFASAFLAQMPVEHLLLDFAPAPGGGTLSGELLLKEKER